MARLVNARTSKVEEIEEGNVAKLIASGEYGFARGTRVPVVNPDGVSGTLPAEEAGKALTGGKYRYQTRDEQAKYIAKKQYEGTAGTLLAGYLGIARGVSGGLYDRLQTEMGVDPGDLNAVKEAHPVISTAAEMTGIAAGVMLPTGPLAAVAKLGRGAQALVAGAKATKALKGSGLAGKALATGIQKATGSAVEGTFYATGHLVSEDALGNTELTAERLAGSIGMGALIGGSFGGVFGVGGPLAMKAGRALKGKVQSTLASKSMADIAASRAVRGLYGMPAKTGRLEEKQGLMRQAGPVGRSAPQTALGAQAGMPAKAGMLEEKQSLMRQVGDELLKPREELGGKAIMPKLGGVRKAFGNIRTIMKSTFEKTSNSLDDLDKLTNKTAIDPRRIAEKIRKDVLAPIAEQPGYKAERKIAQELADEFEELALTKGRISFKEAEVIKRNLYKKIEKSYVKIDLTPKEIIHQQSAHAVMEQIDDAAGSYAKAMGHADLAEVFFQSKKDYGLLREALKISRSGMKRKAGNRSLGLYDIILGTGMAATGGIAFAPAVALGSKLARERGSAVIAHVADRFSKMRAVEKAANETTQRIQGSVSRLVRKFAGRAVKPVAISRLVRVHDVSYGSGDKPGKIKDKRLAMQQRVEELSETVANPEASMERFQSKAQSVADVAPETAMHLAGRAMIAAKVLHDAAPKKHRLMPSITPLADEYSASDLEIARFERVMRAVDQPLSVLEDLESGRLNSDAVRAMRKVYPKLTEEIGRELLTQISDMDVKVPYNFRVQISSMFGVEADPTMRRSFIDFMQQIIPQSGPEDGQGAGGVRLAGVQDITLDQRSATQAQSGGGGI